MKGIRRALALLLALCLLGGAAGAEEKRLHIYTSHKPDVYQPLIDEFEARTGVWVTVETGGTSELLSRIASEDGQSGADLMFGGGVESLDAYNRYFEFPRGVSADHLDEAYLLDGAWLPFSSLPIVIICQRRLTGGRAPSGWVELLTDEWRGQIAFADPMVSGSSYTALATMLAALPGDDAEILSAFSRNLDGRLLGGSGEVVGAVARGDFLVGVTLEETALRAIAAGTDVEIIHPAEGTSAVPDGIAQMKGAKHPENAAAFIRFVLSEDVQKRLGSQFFRRSVLKGLFSEGARAPALVSYDIRWASENRDQILRLWQTAGGGTR